MQVSTQRRLVLHTATFAVWALAALTVGYWALHISSNSKQSNLPRLAAGYTPLGTLNNAGDAATLAQLLGATAPQAVAAPANSSRFVLKGVISGAAGKEAALIAIDDKPAKAFRVGSSVEEGLMLQSASARRVTLSASKDGPAVMTLDMPPLAK